MYSYFTKHSELSADKCLNHKFYNLLNWKHQSKFQKNPVNHFFNPTIHFCSRFVIALLDGQQAALTAGTSYL